MTEIMWKTSVPSTAFLRDAKFSMLAKRKCSLEYFYEGEEDYSAIMKS